MEISFKMNDGKCCVFTHNFKIKKNDVVEVPSNCEVYIIEDNELSSRLLNGLITDNSLIGKKGNFVCISKKSMELLWGVGNIPITVGNKNETAKIYGSYCLEINASKNFVKTFKTSDDYVCNADVRAKTLPIIQNIAKNIIRKFAKKSKDLSYLREQQEKIKKRISEELSKELKKRNFGLTSSNVDIKDFNFNEINIDENKEENDGK